MRYRAKRGLAVLVVVLALAMVAAVLLNQSDPSRISQSTLHSWGTTSDEVVMHPHPREYPVVLEQVRGSEWLGLLGDFTPAPLGRAGLAQAQGYFDPVTESIHITGRIARAQAAIPLPAVRAGFIQVLRHEYGHAFLYEWLAARGDAQLSYLPFMQRSSPPDASAYPPDLRPVIDEYLSSPKNLYGSEYPMSNFAEYIAESYARFLGNDEVPPKTRRFFEEASRPAR